MLKKLFLIKKTNTDTDQYFPDGYFNTIKILIH